MKPDIEIPSHWQWATFDDVADVASNLVDPKLTPQAIHIAPNHIESWTGRLLPFATVEADGVKSSKNRFVSGQILYSKIRPYLAKATLATFDGVCSADMYPVNALIDTKYLLHWILTPWFTGTTARNQGRTVLPKINRDALGRIPVPVGPLREQQLISAKIEELFSDLDAGVAALERAKANLKRYRAAVLKAAVEGKLTEQWRADHPDTEPASQLLQRILTARRQHWEADQLAKYKAKGKQPPKNWKDKYKPPAEPETDGLPELPEGWCWTTVDAIGEIVGGITKGQKRSNGVVLREVPYLRVANVQRGYLDLDVVKSIPATEAQIDGYRLQAGDILFNEGGDRDKLGRGWVWEGQLEECIHQNHVFRVRPFLPEIQSTFISHHGNTFGQSWFMRTGKQSVNLASINMTVLRQFPVPIPPAEEQAEIVNQLDAVLDQVDRCLLVVASQLIRAARLRQSILKRAFAGRLVPQDPDDEPASQLLARIQAARAAVAANGKRTKPKRKRSRRTKAAKG